MPWVVEKMIDFLQEDDVIEFNADEIFNKSFNKIVNQHAQSIKKEY